MITDEVTDVVDVEAESDWYELHLSCFDIKEAIYLWLASRGFYVRPATLRIYGYGPEDEVLSAFQGHIKVSDQCS